MGFVVRCMGMCTVHVCRDIYSPGVVHTSANIHWTFVPTTPNRTSINVLINKNRLNLPYYSSIKPVSWNLRMCFLLLYRHVNALKTVWIISGLGLVGLDSLTHHSRPKVCPWMDLDPIPYPWMFKLECSNWGGRNIRNDV
jgi:hypothetical protein